MKKVDTLVPALNSAVELLLDAIDVNHLDSKTALGALGSTMVHIALENEYERADLMDLLTLMVLDFDKAKKLGF